MKIAVIGASGSVGSRVVSEALARKHSVTAIARNTDKIDARDGLTIVEGDISTPEQLAAESHEP